MATATALATVAAKAQAGQKFVDSEVTPDLSRAAGEYIREYNGTFSFLNDVKAEVCETRKWKSAAQVRGVLNCMVAELRNRKPATTGEQAVSIRDGLYTVVIGDEHRTLRIKTKEDGFQFVSYLNGPNNEADYTCCGTIRGGRFNWTKRFAGFKVDLDSPLRTAIKVVVFGSKDEQTAAGKAYAMESGRCYICNRTLTDPTSIELGIGPICRGE